MAFETLDDLKEYVWTKLPRVRRNAAGRAAVYDLIDIAILEFPDDAMAACAEGSRDEEILADAMVKACKRHYCFAKGEGDHNVGAIWTLILLNIASAIVAELIKWWWKNANLRHKLFIWREGVRGRDG